MGLGIYFIYSTALPDVYLNSCVYISLVLVQANMVNNVDKFYAKIEFAVYTIYRYTSAFIANYMIVTLHHSISICVASSAVISGWVLFVPTNVSNYVNTCI